MTRGDLVLVAVLGAAALALDRACSTAALVAVALDEESRARLRRPGRRCSTSLLAGLAGVTIAVSMRIVGVLLIAALMVLPVIAASADRVEPALDAAALDGDRRRLASWLGLTLSYYGDLAPGGAIVLVAAGAFAVAALAASVKGQLGTG